MGKFDILPYKNEDNEDNEDNESKDNESKDNEKDKENKKEEKTKKFVFKGSIKQVLIDGKFEEVIEMEVEDEADLPLGEGPNKFEFQKLFDEAFGPIDRNDIDTIPKSIKLRDLFPPIKKPKKSENLYDKFKLIKNFNDLIEFLKLIFNKIVDYFKKLFN